MVATTLGLSGCADDDLTASGTEAEEEAGSDSSSEGESGTEGETTAAGLDECSIRLDWEAGTGNARSFPTFEMLTEDASTPSGYRVDVSAAAFPDFDGYLQYTQPVTESLSELDGFGINAEVFMRFDAAFDAALLPDYEGAAGTNSTVGIVVMPEGEDPYLMPLTIGLTDEGQTVIVRPLWPLPSKTKVAFFVKRYFSVAEGECVGASESMRGLLDAGEGDMGSAIDALTGIGVISSSDELAAVQPYVTQSTTDTSFAIAQYIQGLPDEDFVLSNHECLTENDYVYCSSTFSAADFRNENFHVDVDIDDVQPQAPWELTLHSYLPIDHQGELPTILYGHGLTGDGEQAASLAETAAAKGYAVVGIDALMHGDHPSLMGDNPSGLAALLLFFAADVVAGEIDGLKLRDHFSQSAFDKLYVTRVLQAGADLDGDGNSDVDASKLAYHGVSLGGIMGVELLALTDAYQGANLVMPGGGLVQVMTDPMGSFDNVLAALVPTAYSEGDERRLFAMIQTLLDGADPASYGDALVANRPSFASARPHLQVGAVLDDDTVPNSSNWTLARAMGIDIVPPTLRPVLGVSETATPPISLNWEDETTVGLLQFDTIVGGSVATHTNMSFNEVGLTAWYHFLDTLFDTGTAEIIDPYEAIGLDHL